ncbi:hypothetical protein OIO90_002108 [Microbotryomycetes sp. JL221]|nr:hypothetical protein OIO90_002108 [Microbotryomycetes sp. JL221]
MEHVQQFSFETTEPATTLELANTLDNSSTLPAEIIDLLCTLLNPPKACLKHGMDQEEGQDEPSEAEDLVEKERFVRHVPSLIALTRAIAHHMSRLGGPPNIDDRLEWQAKVVMTFARYTGPVPRVDNQSAQSAEEILHLLVPTQDEPLVVRYMLSKTFPPLFKAHPKLNPATGRAVSRPAGGDHAILDWFEQSPGEQIKSWRNEPWFDTVVAWALSSIQIQAVEQSWPLLLPPLLTYLDDYDANHKLSGVALLSILLDKVDASLLRRTGVGAIFDKIEWQRQRSENDQADAGQEQADNLANLIAESCRVLEILMRVLHDYPDRLARFEARIVGDVARAWTNLFIDGDARQGLNVEEQKMDVKRALQDVIRDLTGLGLKASLTCFTLGCSAVNMQLTTGLARSADLR